MTLEELTAILDIYGVDAGDWPALQKTACLEFIATNTQARALLQQQSRLEHCLDQFIVPDLPDLETRVLNQALPALRPSLTDKILEWLLPANGLGIQFWRPAIAACLPLVCGIVLANFFSFGVAVESRGFEYWDDELYMLSLNDYTENLF